MLTPPNNMPMQSPMGMQPPAPMQAPMPPAMMARNNAGRRRGFGDYLEGMLDRPMIAADNMGDFDVFTGQPVVQMRGGGSVYDAYKSDDFKSYTDSKKNTYAPTSGTPGRAVKTHQEIMDSIRGGSSPNDDKPSKPVVVKMDFDDEDYTPTSAELDEAMKDMAAIGMPDLRSDTSVVDFSTTGSGRDYKTAAEADTGVSGFERVALSNANSGLGSVTDDDMGLPSEPVDFSKFESPRPDEVSGVPFNNTIPINRFDSAPPVIPGSDMPNTGMQSGPAYSPQQDSSSYFGDLGGNQPNPAYMSDVFETPPIMDVVANDGVGGGRDPSELTNNVVIQTPEGPQTVSEHIQNFMEQLSAMPGNIANDLKMGFDAGFYTDFEVARQRLLEKGYDPKEVQSWIDRTKTTIENNKKNAAALKRDDDDSPVNPCQPGYVLDPESGICVPEAEAGAGSGSGGGSESTSGPNYSLNRTRDDEFAELDDILKIVEKPVSEMRGGGMAGLNRIADGFLASMGK